MMVRRDPSLRLHHDVVNRVISGVGILCRLIDWTHDPLRSFRHRLAEVGGGEPLPLMSFVDPEHGYGTDGRRHPPVGQVFAGSDPPTHTQARRHGASETHAHALWHKLNLRLLDEAARLKRTTSVLSDEMLANFQSPPHEAMPSSLDVIFRLSARGDSAIAFGDFIVAIDTAVGPPAGRLYSRFGVADPTIRDLCSAICAAEQELTEGALHAEVCLSTDSQLDNTISRFNEYGNEIVVDSSYGGAGHIPIRELWVSVRNGRVVLTHGRNGDVVLAHVTQSVNTEEAAELQVKRVLALVASQPCFRSLRWDWGVLEAAPFLPRVEYSGTILSLARWNFNAADRSAWTDVILLEYIDRQEIPDHVTMIEVGRQGLALDLRVPAMRRLVLRQLGLGNDVSVVELWPALNESAVQSADGSYCHDFILPLVLKHVGKSAYRRGAPDIASRSPLVPRADSKWHCFCLYCGESVMEAALADFITGFGAARGSLVEAWYFTRAQDDRPHIRLRMKASYSASSDLVMSSLAACSDALSKGKIVDFTLTAHFDEESRYGGERSCSAIRDLAAAESQAFLDVLLNDSSSLTDENRVLLIAVGTIHVLNELLEHDGKRILHVLERLLANFMGEVEATGELAAISPRVFRRNRAFIEALYWRNVDSASYNEVLGRFLYEVASGAAQLAMRLARIKAEDRLERTVDRMAPSIVHMLANRVFRFEQRAHELLAYQVALKLQRSLLAREASATQQR
ncbi:MAG TPA: thiopeptide-type bacteriocin biosynthesis protein [Tepidisphaeraceae bacterium]